MNEIYIRTHFSKANNTIYWIYFEWQIVHVSENFHSKCVCIEISTKKLNKTNETIAGHTYLLSVFDFILISVLGSIH